MTIVDGITLGFSAFLGYAIGVVLMCLFMIALVVGFYMLLALPKILHQRRCKHADYWETRSCDAICSHCAKNLGFIGTVRDKK